MPIINHSGTPRHSGRYPWGSGKDPEQRTKSFLGTVKEMKEKGLSEVEIAKGLGMSISDLRIKKSLEKDIQRKADVAQALRLKDKGYSNVAIGKRMGINESSVRALLDPAIEARSSITNETAKILKDAVDSKKYIDVGAGIERHLGISRTKLDTAVGKLEEEGYKVHYITFKQQGTGKNTSMKVLTKEDVSNSEVFRNKYDIKMPIDFHTEDGGRNWVGLETPVSVDSKRIKVRYLEEGGKDKDGLIELRSGVPDISLGNAKYAQVRIGVDDSHFMKGMAINTDDIPKGFDIVYNTKKPLGTPLKGEKDNTVLKPMKDDPITPDNPFGSAVMQKKYIDSFGKEHLSPINIVNEEGKWTEWSRTISSQILSKQRPALAKKQLDLALDIKKDEYEELLSLTNPTVKRKLLTTFSDNCDADAVHLKAAALPRQANAVILPFTSINPNEVYAPNFKNGESVVLIRHPHGGIFEIPELTVNNKNKEADRVLHNAKDAIGIHPTVASKLSGADFDGDTVLIIPNNNGHIKTSPSLTALKDFDPITSYPGIEGMPRLSSKRKEMLMGVVSNLITDMTIKGANSDEIARAVKHSMVIIDAEKHNLNYKQSEIDNNIADLKIKYQGGPRAGAATLISRAGSEYRVPLRKDQSVIDPATGKKLYKYFTGETFVNENGKVVKVTTTSLEEALKSPGDTYKVLVPDKKGRTSIDPITGKKIYLDTKEKVIQRTTKSTKMAEIDDARKLSSGSVIENIYADYANSLKDLANKARKVVAETGPIVYSSSAHKTYSSEVESLLAKLNIAIRHKPLERQAQLLANKNIEIRKAYNPDLDPASLKKLRGQALTEARRRFGGRKNRIDITDKEWEAIQAGAISNNILSEILLNTDLKTIQQKALPKTYGDLMSPSKLSRAKSMLNSGYTSSEVANALGVSVSTLNKSLE